MISQPAEGQLGTSRASPITRPAATHSTRRDGGGVKQRACGPPQVGATVAQQQQEAHVGDPGTDPEQRPASRIAPVGTVLEHAGDQQHAQQRDRQRGKHANAGTLGQDRPRDQRHEDHLNVGEHRREPGADVSDRVMPEQQVGGEEDPGGEAERAARANERAPKRRSSNNGQQRQDRQRVARSGRSRRSRARRG